MDNKGLDTCVFTGPIIEEIEKMLGLIRQIDRKEGQFSSLYAQRARMQSLKLGKALKEFRKNSLDFEKLLREENNK